MSEEKKTQVLIIDDDPGLQKLVMTLLKRAGMKTDSAYNASEAAQILKKQPLPDIVLLDLMLPEINGIDFLKQIRAKSIFNELPVIILSALADPDVIKEGLESGADRYLTKPYLANNLVKTIREVLETGRVIRE
ncbi:MAG: response regulator [Aggregatilineales bacterium]